MPASHWWGKSHQEELVTSEDVNIMGNVLADAQATAAVMRGAQGAHMLVPPQVPLTYGVQPRGATKRLWSGAFTTPRNGDYRELSTRAWSSSFKKSLNWGMSWCHCTWACGTHR